MQFSFFYLNLIKFIKTINEGEWKFEIRWQPKVKKHKCIMLIYWNFMLQMASFVGMQDMNADEMSGKMEDMLSTIRQVNEQFKNPVSI